MVHREHPLGWPSVTTVLKDYAMGWLKFFYKKHSTYDAATLHANLRAEAGDRLHEAMEVLLHGGLLDEAFCRVKHEEEAAVVALHQALLKLDLEMVGSEREVESKQYEYHGSLDGLVKINKPSWLPNEDFLGTPVTVNPGVLTLMDLKTKADAEPKPIAISEMRKHAMQMAAYAQAVQEEDGIDVDLGLIVQLDIPTATVTLHCVYPLQRFLKPFLLQREQFNYINGKKEWAKVKKKK